ncbi:MAG: reductive dehalogenase domain-containing protein, partial [Synergistota bacterium]|nr:reductive dehalogenase domain-containing protein [Synergistota bacterium]
RNRIRKAPGVEEAVETTAGYARAALASIILARSLRNMGYRARAHMDGNYLVVAGRVARDAGLGEFGRNSMLVTPRFGPCVRLSVVTTDAPLVADGAIDFGLRDFCLHCGRCSRQCPAGALAFKGIGENPESDWKVQPEACYRQWSRFGSFCSLCVRNCPVTYAGDRGFEGPLPTCLDDVEKYLEDFDAWAVQSNKQTS